MPFFSDLFNRAGRVALGRRRGAGRARPPQPATHDAAGLGPVVAPTPVVDRRGTAVVPARVRDRPRVERLHHESTLRPLPCERQRALLAARVLAQLVAFVRAK